MEAGHGRRASVAVQRSRGWDGVQTVAVHSARVLGVGGRRAAREWPVAGTRDEKPHSSTSTCGARAPSHRPAGRRLVGVHADAPIRRPLRFRRLHPPQARRALQRLLSLLRAAPVLGWAGRRCRWGMALLHHALAADVRVLKRGGTHEAEELNAHGMLGRLARCWMPWAWVCPDVGSGPHLSMQHLGLETKASPQPRDTDWQPRPYSVLGRGCAIRGDFLNAFTPCHSTA